MTTAKGWTYDEADWTATGWQRADVRTKAVYHVTFDPVWNEWVVIVAYPGSPTTMQRKRRKGLRPSWRVV